MQFITYCIYYDANIGKYVDEMKDRADTFNPDEDEKEPHERRCSQNGRRERNCII